MSALYGGKILWVDLTRGEISVRPTAAYADKYIGGRGINARLIYENTDAGTEPLGPHNLIAFGTGPLSGTSFPGCSRLDVMSKSPVTGLLGNANIGGDWGAELKLAGYDHVVLVGRAEAPVYLNIRNDFVELRDARDLWGGTTYDTDRAIRAELGNPETKVLCIGPAGEAQVSYASIHNNLGNAAARTGMGAVLGSKNVKALAVRGTKGVAIAESEAFLEICLEVHGVIRAGANYENRKKVGTAEGEWFYVLSGMEASGDAHAGPEFDPDRTSDFRAFRKKYLLRRTGCAGCPVHCMDNYAVPGIGGTVLSCELYPQLSWEIRNADMHLWYELVRYTQQIGIDNTSLALCLQWLMELHALGIVDETVTDGIAMEWGSREAIFAMIDLIVRRQGIGDALARGMRAAADYLDARTSDERRGGRSTYYHAMQVNNNPMYGITPRLSSMALSYSVGRRSDCIQDLDMYQFGLIAERGRDDRSETEIERVIQGEKDAAVALTGVEHAGDPDSYEGKAMIVDDIGIVTGIPDMVGSCKWHTKWLSMDVKPEHYARALTSGLGREVTVADLERASLRLRNLERAYECKLGRRRSNDTIPAKEFGKPLSRGASAGRHGVAEAGLEKMKDDYYRIRGWDLETGVPTVETLTASGLDDVAQDLVDRGVIAASADPRERTPHASASGPAE